MCSSYLTTCYYNGTSCATRPAIGNCSEYLLTSAIGCNNLRDGSANACGYVASAAACSAKTCGDVIANPSQSVCVAYLSNCYFNGTSCATKPTTGNCSEYLLTSAIGCNNLRDGSSAACGYVASAASCSAKTCDDVIANPNQTVCDIYKSTCYFNGTSCATKPATGNCSEYLLTSAIGCNNLRDGSSAACGYVASAASCSAKTCGDVIANPSQNVCVNYLSTCFFNGTSCATKPTTGNCSEYLLTSAIGCNNLRDGSSAACGYVASAASCSAKTCGDVIANPSQIVCDIYKATCYFNGTSCATKPATGACSTYTLTSAVACNNLSNASGAACGFVAGASACSDRACTDVIANPS